MAPKTSFKEKVKNALFDLAEWLDGKKTLLLQLVGGIVSLLVMFRVLPLDLDGMAMATLIVGVLTSVARLFSDKPGPLAP